jgi:hypothetical protein
MCSINRGAGPGVLAGMSSSIGGAAPVGGVATSDALYGTTRQAPASGVASSSRAAGSTGGGSGGGGGRGGGYDTHLV